MGRRQPMPDPRISYYRHTNQRKASIATLPFLRVHPTNHRQSPARACNKKPTRYSSPCSSAGTRMPARNPVPLAFAIIPKHAQYMKIRISYVYPHTRRILRIQVLPPLLLGNLVLCSHPSKYYRQHCNLWRNHFPGCRNHFPRMQNTYG
jgi:hypothetical protein